MKKGQAKSFSIVPLVAVTVAVTVVVLTAAAGDVHPEGDQRCLKSFRDASVRPVGCHRVGSHLVGVNFPQVDLKLERSGLSSSSVYWLLFGFLSFVPSEA